MNVLLLGGYSSFTNNLIVKLNKEGHKVYLLTGSRKTDQPYQKVFERYNFPYDSSCLNEIFESINPDVTIYMGAYDSNFDWKQEESESVKYSACMMNILMSFITSQNGRFIYLSSQAVYDDNSQEKFISEDVAPTPKNFKSMILTQAEELCETYRKSCNKDIVVLRLDHCFALPETMEDVTEPCAKMCLAAMNKHTIPVEANHGFSMLYVSDAIEYMYRLIRATEHRYPLYNISSEKVITERQLAEMVRHNLKENVEIIDTGMIARQEVLSCGRFRKEFGSTYLCDNDSIVKKLVMQMDKYRRVFLNGESKKRSLNERIEEKLGEVTALIVPYIENFVAFIIFFLLNNRAVGSRFFSGLDFYLLYVLLFAIVYGQKQAILSATLAVFGYCFRQLYDRSGFDLMLDSNTYVWIAQLFILGLVVGYMRDNITKLRNEQKTEREFMSMQLADIKEINDTNVRVKDALEMQIINQSDSVGKIFSITSSLNQYSEEEVLFYATEMVGRLMKSEDVAIYTVSNANYARLFSATSDKAKRMGASIHYTELGELYETLRDGQVYINRKLEEKLPLMASAIYDDEKNMTLIIMIWGIPWESMTLGQANQLVVIGSLIREAVMRANKYLKALESDRYIEGTKMLEPEAFTSLVNAYLKAEGDGLTDCVLLGLHRESEIDYAAVSEWVTQYLRKGDYLGLMDNKQMGLLLSNTNKENATHVIDRLKEAGFETEILEDCAE